MLYAQPRISPGEQDTQNPLGFLDTNGSPVLDQTTWPSNKQEKKEHIELLTLLSRLTIE